jgi:hypothetical protein
VRLIKLASFIVIFQLVTGCATTSKLAQYKPDKNGVTLVFEINQETLLIEASSQQMGVTLALSGGGAIGGALGALADIEIARREQRKLDPIVVGLIEMDLNKNFKATLGSTIDNIKWLAASAHLDKNQIDQTNLKVGSHVILVELSYFLTSDIESIVLDAKVSLKKVERFRGSSSKRLPKYSEIYSNRYRYVSEIVKAKEKDPTEVKLELDRIEQQFQQELDQISRIKDIRVRKLKRRDLRFAKNQARSELRKAYTSEQKEAQLIRHWSENSSARVIEALNDGIIELQKMINTDLSYINDPAHKLLSDPHQLIEKSYWLVEESHGRVIAQKKGRRQPGDFHGNFCSFVRAQGSDRCT